MIDKENLQKEVDELEKLASDIETGVRKLITEAPKTGRTEYAPATKTHYTIYHWKELPKELEPLQRDLTRDYQRLYSSAGPIIHKYIPEREAEFNGSYTDLLKQIQLKVPASATESMIANFIKSFEVQRSILLSVPSAARIKELIK